MLGRRKDEYDHYGERASARLRMLEAPTAALEGADPAAVRQRLRNTMTGASRRLNDRGDL